MNEQLELSELADGHREPQVTHASFLPVLVKALSGRALGASEALLVFVLGCWAMVSPTLLRAEVAAGFAVFVLVAAGLRAWSER